MLIRAGCELVFELPKPTAFTTLLNVVPERRSSLLRPDLLGVYCNGQRLTSVDYYNDSLGNCRGRFQAPAGELRLYNDFIVLDSGLALQPPRHGYQHLTHELSPQCLEFLLPSRYCEVDELSAEAWKLFGHVEKGWPRVQAVCDWIQSEVAFGDLHACQGRTAAQTFREKVGVCRDFNHLAVTFCRALNIPARYATAYLPDIDVPATQAPMDFSACFEVYLSGRWHLWDAGQNRPRIGWILLGRGRDATDCAMATSFGAVKLCKFEVWADEIAHVPAIEVAPASTPMRALGQRADVRRRTRDNYATI